MSYKIGIDVGGTHTDFVLLGDDGTIVSALKVPSTPNAPVEGIAHGLAGIDGRDEISTYVNGTTIGTNAVLQRRLPTVGLITTTGYRDALLIRRETKENIYDLFWDKPDPLVLRRHIFEIDGRLDYLGNVLKPIDLSQLPAIVQAFKQHKINNIAVCLLHSYANNEHEEALADALAKQYPEAEITLSSRTYPEWREFERTYSTVLNASLAPVISGYLRSLQRDVVKDAPDKSVFVMQANGGITGSEEIVKRPVLTLYSGVAGGAIGGAFLASESKCDKVITLDMGGTSTDMCIVEDGTPTVTSELFLEWEGNLGFSAVDVQSIGAGGGSIAWLDEVGALRVGPRSAGADPGPACYARGGNEPTVTDANVMLGYINPEAFLGGKGRLDPQLSEKVLGELGQKTKLSPVDLALGIVRIVNANMLNGLRQVSVEKGYDPREFTLVCCGGAGPLHAAALMTGLGIPRTLIPLEPGNVSAFGMVAARPKAEESRTHYVALSEVDLANLIEILGDLEARATNQLTRSGVAGRDVSAIWSLDMRYEGQTFEINVPIDALSASAQVARDPVISKIADLFNAEHMRRYTYAKPDEPIMIVHVRVTAEGPAPSLNVGALLQDNSTDGDVQKVEKEACFDVDGQAKSMLATVARREELSAGSRLEGPAIIEESGSTTVVPPGYSVTVDSVGNMMLEEV